MEARACRADVYPEHAASRRRVSPYCEQHFPEYQAHRKRYNDMKYNYTHGRTSVVPPEPESFWNSVQWSPLTPQFVQVDHLQRRQVEDAYNAVRRANQVIRSDRFAPPSIQRERLTEVEKALAQLGRVLRDANLISIPISDRRLLSQLPWSFPR